MKPIPIKTAENVAKTCGYDQVIIYARKVGEDPDPHGEHMTTYGVNEEHCGVAGRIGSYLQREIMKWHDCWETRPFPQKGLYVVSFYLDQGNGHGHYETLVCEHDPEYGDNALTRPDFKGVGSPSIVSWYGPLPPNKYLNE